MTVNEKLEFRRRYVALSFWMLVGMVVTLPTMALFHVPASTITAVATGYIGIGASFAAIIAAHFGFTPKDTTIKPSSNNRYSRLRQ